MPKHKMPVLRPFKGANFVFVPIIVYCRRTIRSSGTAPLAGNTSRAGSRGPLPAVVTLDSHGQWPRSNIKSPMAMPTANAAAETKERVTLHQVARFRKRMM